MRRLALAGWGGQGAFHTYELTHSTTMFFHRFLVLITFTMQVLWGFLCSSCSSSASRQQTSTFQELMGDGAPEGPSASRLRPPGRLESVGGPESQGDTGNPWKPGQRRAGACGTFSSESCSPARTPLDSVVMTTWFFLAMRSIMALERL